MTSKRKNPEETPTVKTIGRILEVLGLPFLIVVAVLLNMETKNLAMIDLLLAVGVTLFVVGLIFSHLPQENEK